MAILACVACLILIGGWLARPRNIPQSPTPVPSETELEQLSRRAERRSLESMAKFFAGVARDVGSSVARVRPTGISGIAWDDGRLVTAPLRDQSEDRVVVASGAREADAQRTLSGPNLPLTVLAVSTVAAGLTSARRPASGPRAGDWMVAVWRTDAETAFAAGNFRQLSPIKCFDTTVEEMLSSLSLVSAMRGGGLFDLNGDLLAVILPCHDRLAAVATASIDALLDRANTVEQRLRGQYGLGVGPLSAEEQRYFKTGDGLLVREVWTGLAADVAGFRPGDIITAVAGERIVAIDDLQAVTTTRDAAREWSVQRAAKKLTMMLPPPPLDRAAGTDRPPGGLMIGSPPRSHRVDSVQPGSRAAMAGIEPGDHLLRIDRAEVGTVDQLLKMFEKPAPIWLEIERDGRRLGMLSSRVPAP